MNEIRAAVRETDPDLAIARVHTLNSLYDRSMARTRFTLVMLGIAGGMALVIGVIGLYGVVAYTVAERRREVGIRMALGAEAGDPVTYVAAPAALMLAASTACYIPARRAA